MHVVFVTSRFPYPPTRGDQARAYHQIRLLAARHRISLVAPAPSDNGAGSLAALRPHCAQITLLPWRPLRRAIRAAARFPFSRLPLQALYFGDLNRRRAVERVCASDPVDVLHFQTARVGPAITPAAGPARVIDFVDSLALNLRRRAELERWPAKLVARLESARLVKYERLLAVAVDRAVVSSAIDADFIGPSPRLHIVANGVDLERFPFVGDTGRNPHLIVFTGRMSYFPNADAAAYFACEVMPLIRMQVPNAEFVIVGAGIAKAVARRCQAAGATVTGYVDDLHAWLARAGVAVAPMRAGSGMQFKVLEAMASGAAVVATKFALGGLGASQDQHLLVANGASELAAQVMRVVRDNALRRRLAAAGRVLVERNYSWERSAAELERVYELALEGRRAVRPAPRIVAAEVAG